MPGASLDEPAHGLLLSIKLQSTSYLPPARQLRTLASFCVCPNQTLFTVWRVQNPQNRSVTEVGMHAHHTLSNNRLPFTLQNQLQLFVCYVIRNNHGTVLYRVNEWMGQSEGTPFFISVILLFPSTSGKLTLQCWLLKISFPGDLPWMWEMHKSVQKQY